MFLKSIFRFVKNAHEARFGFRIYKKLVKRFGAETVICVNQHKALGDAYLMSLYLPRYFADKAYAVATIGKSSAEIFGFAEIKNVAVLTQQENDALISFARTAQISEESIKILHHQALKWHIGIAWQLQGVNGMNFALMIEKIVFRGLGRNDRKYPRIYNDNSISQSGIEYQSSVILFPQSNTLTAPGEEFWREIVRLKKKEGKKIYTFMYENPEYIEGTEPIRLEIQQLMPAAEYAGEIICARSGLSDILSTAKCKKTIVYPPGGCAGWIHGTLLDFWSLKGFGYCTDATEITWPAEFRQLDQSEKKDF